MESRSASIAVSGNDLENIISLGSVVSTENHEQQLFRVEIETERIPGKRSQPAIFWLHYDLDAGEFSIVGIEHPG
jgi:hypothetical protein